MVFEILALLALACLSAAEGSSHQCPAENLTTAFFSTDDESGSETGPGSLCPEGYYDSTEGNAHNWACGCDKPSEVYGERGNCAGTGSCGYTNGGCS